jgi:hypothetical protein
MASPYKCSSRRPTERWQWCRRVALGSASAFALLALSPALAFGGQNATISARFTPEHLAAATTISFGFRIATEDEAPAPLLGVELTYPRNLGFATSGLGVAACSDESLELLGPSACPPNSRMGSGSALVGIRIGPELVEEPVSLTLFSAPSTDGHLHLLVYASGRAPVIGGLVLGGVLAGGRINVTVPPIPSLPEAPYVAVSRLQLTLGGDLRYYEPTRDGMVAYRPAGIRLPNTCPPSGFQFTARFAFLGGEHSSARTTVRCPAAHRHH